VGTVISVRIPGVHVDDEVGVFGGQGHLSLGVAPVGGWDGQLDAAWSTCAYQGFSRG
jgi:hypothetical protein